MQTDLIDPNGTRFPTIRALILYFISFGLSLTFLDARFWDDWYVNFTLSKSETMQYWKDMLGFFPTNRFVEVSILDRNPVAFHLVIFVSFFITGYLIFKILEYVPRISYVTRSRIALLFLVLPINSARVSMVTIRLTYSLVLFLVAWLLLLKYKSIYLKVFSLILFCISFLAQGLVPFFVLPCLHLFFIEFHVKSKSLHLALMQPVLLLGSGGAYFAAMRLLDPPPGNRLDYYTPSLSGIVRAFVFLIVATWFLWRSFKYLQKSSTQDFDGVQLLGLGVFALALGAFAYVSSGRLMDISEWMLNFVPRASDWDSRQQLLLGLGFSLITVGFLELVPNIVAKNMFTFAVVVSVFLNISFMRDYLMDWKKQTQIISSIENLEIPSDSKIVMVVESDAAKKFNARGRNIRNYEWEALLEKGLNRKGLSVIYNNRIDCESERNLIPDLLMTVEAKNSNLRAILKLDPGAYATIESIDPC